MVAKNTKSKTQSDSAAENGVEEEPCFSDPEDFEDDIPDEEFLADILKERPLEAEGLESVIVIDNIPQVGADRLEKLKNVLKKIFGGFGEIINEEIPLDESGKTKGFMFMEYKDVESAMEAVKATNGHKLDKQHAFAVCPFTDFQKYEQMPEDWKPPQPQAYQDHGNLEYYLQEPECREQFVVMYQNGDKVSINLNTFPEDTKIEERDRWTDTSCCWSPRGTFLATVHLQGIALWGGEKFAKIQRFKHYGARYMDFSPGEKYLVTFNPNPPPTGRGGPTLSDEDMMPSVIVWDILTGLKKRSFSAGTEEIMWPVFKWSHDDKYFARQTTDVVSIYETPVCGMLDKKSLKILGLRSFSWCPTQNIMAYWVGENKDVPARVTLIELPSRKELRSKNLFNVADCRMHWQKNGDFLCVKVDRYTKAKRENNTGGDMKYSGLYFNFEVFMIREKQIPVDSTEIKDTCVTAFAWEPTGSKFAVIHGDAPHISVSFYQVKQQSVVLLKKLDRKQCNHLFWSPNGQFVVLAGLKQMNGCFEFIDTNHDFALMGNGEHFRATDVEWDPTGRYVMTGVSHWAHSSDNAYWMWSFQGKPLKKVSLPQFCQFLWRPRPPSLLTDEMIKDIRKNFKKYSQQFEIKDRASMSKVSKEIMDHRQRLMEQHRQWVARKAEKLEQMRERRLELRDGLDTDEIDANPGDLTEEVIEFLVKEEETVVSAA